MSDEDRVLKILSELIRQSLPRDIVLTPFSLNIVPIARPISETTSSFKSKSAIPLMSYSLKIELFKLISLKFYLINYNQNILNNL